MLDVWRAEEGERVTDPADEDRQVRNDFLKTEYLEIRAEILERLKSLWAFERFAFGGAAAITAWLFTHSERVGDYPIAWWLPFAFLLICSIRFLSANYHLSDRAAEYLIKVEEELLGKEGGYEKWFAKKPLNETLAYVFSWALAIALSLALAITKAPPAFAA